jgi:RNA polymerase sigma-70 factor (ECF subfamily)
MGIIAPGSVTSGVTRRHVSTVPDTLRHATTLGDAALLKAARELDENALVTIFDQYAPAIYKYALRLCGDPVEADDFVGEVFTQLLDHLSHGNGPRDNLRSYLYQIAYHKVVDRSRKLKHTTTLDDSMPSGAAEMPSSRQEDRELLDELEIAISSHLTRDQRHILVLRYMEDFSLQETAEITGKKLNNVKVIQNRALARLRQVLSQQAGENP